MLNNYKEFSKKHPYGHVILLMVLSSFIGISIEYIVNKNFIGGGLYTAIALTLIELFRVRRRTKEEN